MKWRFLLVFLYLTVLSPIYAQIDESVLYKNAYKYLNDSIIKKKYKDSKSLEKDCEACCMKGIKLKFSKNLQVAENFIANNSQFPFIQYITSKHKLSDSCLKDLRMEIYACEVSKKHIDSLNVFWKEYKMKDIQDILKSLKSFKPNKKGGYQVFFSDIYKNTLAAELMIFCGSYDKVRWQGNSTSFYFIFDDQGNIKSIYKDIIKHYN